MSLRLRLPAGCVQRCRICDRPPHNSRRVRNAQIIFARSKKGKKRAKQGRAFRRIFPLSPPCATTPAAARCQRPPWCVVASRQGGRPQSLRGKKGREKRSSHLDFDKFRAGQQQLPGKDIAGGKSGFSRDVGLPG